jgi:D-glycero-D-manno-heptose 1,7-bisphosphate phosphatase
MRAAVFADRDGTLIEEMHYISEVSDVRLIKGAARGVAALNRAGVPLVIVSNQAGVARGMFSENEVLKINRRVLQLLEHEGARADAIYYCPHHPEIGKGRYLRKCRCRKPGPGMIEAAAADLNIDVPASFVVGDKISDVELAASAGCRGSVLVLTGYGKEHLKLIEKGGRKPDFVAEDFRAAAEWILKLLNINNFKLKSL